MNVCTSSRENVASSFFPASNRSFLSSLSPPDPIADGRTPRRRRRCRRVRRRSRECLWGSLRGGASRTFARGVLYPVPSSYLPVFYPLPLLSRRPLQQEDERRAADADAPNATARSSGASSSRTGTAPSDAPDALDARAGRPGVDASDVEDAVLDEHAAEEVAEDPNKVVEHEAPSSAVWGALAFVGADGLRSSSVSAAVRHPACS